MIFRRKSAPAESDASAPAEETDATAGASADPVRAAGPWDISEVDLDEDDPTRIDLGGLVVKGRPGLEVRVQVDEASQQVAAVLVVGKEGAVELRPFAAPRSGGTWPDIRRQIAAETARRGGTATEAEGGFGTELRVNLPARTKEGQTATQPSRVLGIEGPRWLLRATLLGRPAMEPEARHELEDVVRDVVVRRGSGPMAPGDPLPLVMPPGARPAQPRDSAG